jgi:hypothetical protein
MSEPLDYGRPPVKRWTSVVLWAGCVLAFGALGLGLFSYLTTRNTGAAVPTAAQTILGNGPLWFIYPYHGLVTCGMGERGLVLVVLEVFFLYPLYAVFFGIAAYRGRPRRLLIILLIVHVMLGAAGIWLFIAADAEFHRRRSARLDKAMAVQQIRQPQMAARGRRAGSAGIVVTR